MYIYIRIYTCICIERKRGQGRQTCDREKLVVDADDRESAQVDDGERCRGASRIRNSAPPRTTIGLQA